MAALQVETRAVLVGVGLFIGPFDSVRSAGQGIGPDVTYCKLYNLTQYGRVDDDQGDLGPGVREDDRVDVGFLPGDIDQNGSVTPADLLRFVRTINDITHHPLGVDRDYVDTDRSGSIEPFDLLAYRQLINGIPPSTRPWASAAMNHAQP